MNDLADWGEGEFCFGLYNTVSEFSISWQFVARAKNNIYQNHILTVLHNAKNFVPILMARVPLSERFAARFSEPAVILG